MRRLLSLALTVLSTALVVAALTTSLRAVEPDEILKDPALETRARALSAELRCLVCQNQSIDDSNAPLARDLRLLVRERLQAGDSNAEIIEFVVARYGEFVLLRPRFSFQTLVLWLSPIVLLLLGIWLTLGLWRRRGAVAVDVAAPLSPEEEKRIAELVTRDTDEVQSSRRKHDD